MMGRGNNWIVWAMAAAAAGFGGRAGAADAPPRDPPAKPEMITVDRQTLQQMVHDEVQRQLKQIVDREATAVRVRQEASRGSSLLSMLQTLRSQFQLYKLQHNDALPTAEAMAKDWAPLRGRTDIAGQVVASGIYGPYLEQSPRNPFNGRSKVAAMGHASPEDGWAYDAKTGNVKAVLPSSMRGKPGPLAESDVEFVDAGAASASVK